MASDKSKRSSRGRTREAKLLITAASVAATLSGLAMFATQYADTQAQNQSNTVVAAPVYNDGVLESGGEYGSPEADEDTPYVAPTPAPAPVTGRTRGLRGSRSQQGQQGLPNPMGTTRSSR